MDPEASLSSLSRHLNQNRNSIRHFDFQRASRLHYAVQHSFVFQASCITLSDLSSKLSSHFFICIGTAATPCTYYPSHSFTIIASASDVVILSPVKNIITARITTPVSLIRVAWRYVVHDGCVTDGSHHTGDEICWIRCMPFRSSSVRNGTISPGNILNNSGVPRHVPRNPAKSTVKRAIAFWANQTNGIMESKKSINRNGIMSSTWPTIETERRILTSVGHLPSQESSQSLCMMKKSPPR